ncbi:MAG: hypothetical protein ACP5RM_01795 [Candidatus Micrarchaeia archaeon]
MAEDINFIDLIALTRIKPDTTVEKFGGLINSSFFDASNILGSLKQKGLIDFTTSFPGQSAITVTDLGKKEIVELGDKEKEDFDVLDFTIITQLANGKRGLTDLSGAVNVRQHDLAVHLFKLANQQYLSYDIRNGTVDITLTEKGFLQVKSGMPKPKVQEQASIQQAQAPQATQEQAGAIMAQQQPAVPQQAGVQQASIQQAQDAQAQTQQNAAANALDASMAKAKKQGINMIIGAVAVLVIVIIILVLIYAKIL